jgi:hypothetical protein
VTGATTDHNQFGKRVLSPELQRAVEAAQASGNGTMSEDLVALHVGKYRKEIQQFRESVKSKGMSPGQAREIFDGLEQHVQVIERDLGELRTRLHRIRSERAGEKKESDRNGRLPAERKPTSPDKHEPAPEVRAPRDETSPRETADFGLPFQLWHAA